MTETQKRILRLVLLRFSSKDIGRELGLSPHTIDNHIKAAIARLRVGSRAEAARELAEHEGETGYRALTSPSPALPECPADPPSIVLVEPGRDDLQDGKDFARRSFLPTPRFWGEENTLGTGQRLMWIIILIVMISLSLGAILASLRALNDLI